MKKHNYTHLLVHVCCILALLCLTPLSMVQAEESTFSYDGPLNPYTTPMLLDASTIIQFDNSNVCSEWDKLTEEQQTTILSNIGLNNYNFAFVTDNDIVYLGKAIWCSEYSNGVYRLHSESNVTNPGFYIVNEDGTLTRGVELGNFSIKSIFFAQYRVGSIWFENIDVRNNSCEVPDVPTLPPSLDLPNANMPSYSVNTEQTTYIDTYGSPAISGGRISALAIDYYNVYSVVQTAQSDEFFNSRNDNYYSYQLVNGEYIFAVYDYSELQLFAPNMAISNTYFDFVNYEYGDFTYVYIRSGKPTIQKDVSEFKMKYVDRLKKSVYSFDKLPFSSSQTNKNHLEYLGTTSENDYYFISSASIEITLPTESSDILLYACITDKYDTIQYANNIDNQTIINNNMNSNFNQLDNQLKDMASTNDNGQFNQLGNELITSVENQATSLFYPVTWAIDTLNDMSNVEEKAIITLPALFKTNETYDIDFSVVENELPQLFTFIRSIIWIALAMLCINGVQHVIGGGNNDN